MLINNLIRPDDHKRTFFFGRGRVYCILLIFTYIHINFSIHEHSCREMDHYKYVETVSVDLNMAFDNVDHNILVQKLNNYGVQGLDLILFESYLSDCKQCTTIESVDSSIKK